MRAVVMIWLKDSLIYLFTCRSTPISTPKSRPEVCPIFKSPVPLSHHMEAMDTAGIYVRESQYLDSFVQIGVAGGRVLSVSFPELPEEDAEDEHPILDRIFEYLQGVTEVEFDDVTVALTIPTDQQRVLEQVQTIPYGEQIGVKALARMTADLDPEDEDDLILVRTALDENPAPLLIPDHRVRDGPSAAPPQIEQKLRSLEEL